MAEKKKDDLAEILKKHRMSGDSSQLVYRFRGDVKEYEKGLDEARILTRPDSQTRLKALEYEALSKVKKTIESYLSGQHVKNIKKNLKEGEEMPEHQKHGFSHLKEADAKKHAKELLHEMSFSGIEHLYGKKAAEAARKEASDGNDRHLRDFIEKYLLPPARTRDGQTLDSSLRLEIMIEQLSKTDHLLSAIEDGESPLRQFVTEYSDRLNPYADVLPNYQVALGRLATESPKHHELLQKKATKVLGDIGYKPSSHADRNKLLEFVFNSHKGGGYDPNKNGGLYAEKLPEKKAA